MEYTPEEQKVIDYLRNLKVEFGKVILTVYFQHGKLVRVESERKVVESKVITG